MISLAKLKETDYSTSLHGEKNDGRQTHHIGKAIVLQLLFNQSIECDKLRNVKYHGCWPKL